MRIRLLAETSGWPAISLEVSDVCILDAIGSRDHELACKVWCDVNDI